MPKNVAGRLLNLENEMKTVMSICDISTRGGTRSNMGLQGRSTSKVQVRCTSSTQDHSTAFRSSQPQTVPEESNGKSQQQNELSQEVRSLSGYLRKKLTFEKPSSAPTSALTTIKEGESNMKKKRSPVIAVRSGRKVDVVDSAEWFDSPAQDTTAEKTLRPPNEILTDITQCRSEKYFPKKPSVWCAMCRRTVDCICQSRRCRSKVTYQADGASGREQCPNSQSNTSEDAVIHELVRKIERKEMETQPIKSKRIPTPAKPKVDPSVEGERYGGEVPHKHASEVNCSVRVSEEPLYRYGGRPVSTPVRCGSRTEQASANVEGDVGQRETVATAAVAPSYEEEHENLSEIPEESNSQEGAPVVVENLYYCPRVRNDRSPETYDRRGNVHWVRGAAYATEEQGSCQSDDASSVEYYDTQDIASLEKKKGLSVATTRNIAQIIERNHEKVEEMRRSKRLALKTAKQLKHKYDTVTTIKNEMAEKLKELLNINRRRIAFAYGARVVARKRLKSGDHLRCGALAVAGETCSTESISRLRLGEESLLLIFLLTGHFLVFASDEPSVQMDAKIFDVSNVRHLLASDLNSRSQISKVIDMKDKSRIIMAVLEGKVK